MPDDSIEALAISSNSIEALTTSDMEIEAINIIGEIEAIGVKS